MIARRLLVAALALLIAAQVVRNAAVAALATAEPDAAARLWSDHPEVALTKGLTDIARAARAGDPVPEAVLQSIYRTALKAPLAPQPFLVRGVQAQMEGDAGAATRAFAAAQWRDPRSLPAAYFLADRYFRTGEAELGLRQLGVLSRLSPNGKSTVAPYIAAYARNRANWPALQRLFAANSELQDAALVELAQSPDNADAVLALGRSAPGKANSARWLPVLVNSLVEAGHYNRARAVWQLASGAKPRSAALLYDSGFSDSSAPPPFNWSLNSSTVGLAERQPGGRLHLLYYGEEEGALARQLLLLPAGGYRLTMNLLGDRARAKALSWTLRCEKSAQPFASISFDAAVRGWTFRVPADCPAQWLELSARSGDMPQQVDVTISALRLRKEGSGA